MSFHILAVYFPVGVLTASVVFDLIAQATGREELARAGWWCLAAGAFFAGVALVTGLLEPVSPNASQGARSIVNVHGTLAYVALVLFGILLLWRLVGQGHIGARWRPAYLAAAVIAAAILLATAYSGARAVYIYGLGIPDETLESALKVRRGPQASPGPAPGDTQRADTAGLQDDDSSEPVDTIRTD